MDDAEGFVLWSVINGIIGSLTRTHLMTKGSEIAEITDLSQDYHAQTKVYAYLHKQEQKFLGRTRTK